MDAKDTLRLHVLASSSKGNASLVENLETGQCVLIDCGISKKEFLARSAKVGIDPGSVAAILVTHEHSDHTKGLGVVTRGLAKLGVHPPLFVSTAVFSASRQIQEIADACDLRSFTAGSDLDLAGMTVHAFGTSHDAAESFGFRFSAGTDAIGFMTDTGVVTGEAHEALQNCSVLAIETNHDPQMLKYGPYPYPVKTRIAGECGHLSNEQAGAELESLLCNELRAVVGMHVSENNNEYDLALKTLEMTLKASCHPACALVGRQAAPLSVLPR